MHKETFPSIRGTAALLPALNAIVFLVRRAERQASPFETLQAGAFVCLTFRRIMDRAQYSFPTCFMDRNANRALGDHYALGTDCIIEPLPGEWLTISAEKCGHITVYYSLMV